MGKITEEHIQRIVMNPFYAIRVASRLVISHVPSLRDEDWIAKNKALIQEMGAEQWLTLLLETLQGDAGEESDAINPYQAINIDPMYAQEHAPVYSVEQWIQMNTLRLKKIGTERWLSLFLDILEGDFVTADEISRDAPSQVSDSIHFSGKKRKRRRQKK